MIYLYCLHTWSRSRLEHGFITARHHKELYYNESHHAIVFKRIVDEVSLQHCLGAVVTRKLSYRKDDRAMRPMHGRPENFQESLTTHTATFPEFLMGFCSD